MTENELQLGWQSQAVKAPEITIEYLLYRVKNLERSARREYFVGLFGIALCVVVLASLFLSSTALWPRLVYVALAIQTAYGAYRYRRDWRPKSTPDVASSQEALVFYRAQLENKRRQKAWSWRHVISGVGGMTALLTIQWVYVPEMQPIVKFELVAAVILFALAMLESRREATKLQMEIDSVATLG